MILSTLGKSKKYQCQDETDSTVSEKPCKNIMGIHHFSTHSPPMLRAVPKRKTKVLLAACEVLSDTPLTSPLSTSHLLCLSSYNGLLAALPTTLRLLPPLSLPSLPGPICPSFLLSDLSSNVIFPETPTSAPQPECLFFPPPHGHRSLSSYCM